MSPTFPDLSHCGLDHLEPTLYAEMLTYLRLSPHERDNGISRCNRLANIKWRVKWMVGMNEMLDIATVRAERRQSLSSMWLADLRDIVGDGGANMVWPPVTSSPEGRSVPAGSGAFFATPFIPQGAAFRLDVMEEMRTGRVEDIIRNAGPFRPMDVIGIFEHSIREGPRRVAINEVLAAARESGRLPSEAEAVLTELRAAVTAAEFQMQLQIEERDRERDERMVHLMDLAGRALFGRASVARCHREGRGAGAP